MEKKNKRVGATQPKKKRLHKFSGAWGEIAVGLLRPFSGKKDSLFNK